MGGSLIAAAKRATCSLIDQNPESNVRVLAFDDRLVLINVTGTNELKTPKTRISGLCKNDELVYTEGPLL